MINVFYLLHTLLIWITYSIFKEICLHDMMLLHSMHCKLRVSLGTLSKFCNDDIGSIMKALWKVSLTQGVLLKQIPKC